MTINVFFGERKLTLTDKFNKISEKKKCILLKYPDGIIPDGLINWFKTADDAECMCVLTEDVDNVLKNISSSFKVIEAAGGIVENDKDEVLGIFRRGVWDLPKGKAEEDEVAEITALREVCEECGIGEGLELKRFICFSYHTYKLNGEWILKRTAWFKMNFSGKYELRPQTEEDITDLKWIKKTELKDLYKKESFESIKQVIKHYLKQIGQN